MHLKRLAVIVAALIVLVVPAAASAAKPDGKGKGKGGANVEQLGTLPLPGAVGANFKVVDGTPYMFATGFSGLYVYDISDPAKPTPAGILPLGHYQNEDVSIGGNRLLISFDGAAGSNLFVIDISNPRLPRVEQVINMQLLGEGHTATCIQECRYAWVAGDTTSIAVLDLDKNAQFETPGDAPDVQVQGATSQVEVGDLRDPDDGGRPFHEFGWSTHDVQVDRAGIAWVVGGNGTIGFDVNPDAYPNTARENPNTPVREGLLEPEVVARTGPNATADSDFDSIPGSNGEGDTVNDFIHHNSWRPDAEDFESRADSDLGDTAVREGELVLITEEDIWSRDTFTTPAGCESQGSFQTWQVKQLGATGPTEGTVENLDSWTTEFNEAVANDENPVTGNDVVPTGAGLCSAHYFDYRRDVVAIGWYAQGLRFLDVSDPGDISQTAYFMPVGSSMFGAYWAPNARDIVYAVDNGRGVIDVLRYNRKAAARSGEVTAPIRRHWFNGERDAVAHAKFGWVCQLAAR